MQDREAGLAILRASRLEALLEALGDGLDAQPPVDALAPQTIIAAHPGMKHWLSGALARRQGPRGIAANLDIVLPSAWLERLAVDLLGKSAVALGPYQRARLRWRIHALLPTLEEARVQRYLAVPAVAPHASARRHFQLADRLARLYAQYLVYRPDWLALWAAGKRLPPAAGAAAGDDALLAPLWEAVRREVGVPHRGELVSQVLAALRRPQPTLDPGPLHVFGVSHLAPSELAVLAAAARHRPVRLYVPDPCREYWLDQRPDRERLRAAVRDDPRGHDAESLFLGDGHPLLAAWGRMGQHFMLALEDLDAQIDIRDSLDDASHDPGSRRLPRLQESIRRFDTGLLAPAGDLDAQRADDSLRVHACHTRLRELEVLRDALLRLRVDHPHVRPSGIVVMAPDIHAYVPLLPAVFGEAGVHGGPLPYHVADVAVARSHPLFEAFRRVLDLPAARITAPEVADLLALPAVARRFNLADADVETLVGWLRDSRVAWALDARFKADFDVPPLAMYTFAWGMDRLLAGYLMGGEDPVVALPDGERLAPLAGVQGPQAALLGALDALLVQLARWHRFGRAAQPASAWAIELEQALDGLLRIDATDAAAREADAQLRRFVRGIGSEPAEAGLDPELDFAVVRELLVEHLDAAPERQRFLMGGVTFCGMVPQRAIPFDIVAVLGLNDGEFPRAGGDGGLDLMATRRRLGDRDVRSDDRYLFLETVMSARVALHLSFVGEGVRDGKPRNPAAPLAELLGALEDAAWPGEDDPAHAEARTWPALPPERQPWLVRHPLQPFDGRYFDGADVRLQSFDARMLAMAGSEAGADGPAPFHRGPEPVVRDDATPPAAIALHDVLAYFKDPARHVLARGLDLRLDALDDARLPADEPLEAKVDAIERVARRVLFDVLATPDRVLPDDPPEWLRVGGLLPPGRLGDEAWAGERGKVRTLLDAALGIDLFRASLPPPAPLLVDRAFGRHRLAGELRRVHACGQAWWVLDAFPGKNADQLTFKERVGLFLEWALARLADPRGTQAVHVCALVEPSKSADAWLAGFDRWNDGFMRAVREGDAAGQARRLAELEHRVAGLLDFWSDAQRSPPWFFPKTSWVAVAADANEHKVRRCWAGDGYSLGERDHAPGYARLLAGERRFDDDEDFLRLCQAAERLRGLITLEVDA